MNFDKLKNKDYIVLLPASDNDIKDGVSYSFDNVYVIDNMLTNEQVNEIINFINETANSIILFDYDESYRRILPHIRKQKKVRWVIRHNVSYMTQGAVREAYFNLMEFCDRNIVDVIGCLDKSTYQILKNAGYNAKYINLGNKVKGIIITNPNANDAQFNFEYSWKRLPPLLNTKNSITDITAPTKYVIESDANGLRLPGTDFAQIWYITFENTTSAIGHI